MRPISLSDLMKNMASGSTASASSLGCSPSVSPFGILANASRDSLPMLAPSHLDSSTFYFDTNANYSTINSKTNSDTNSQHGTSIHDFIGLLMSAIDAGMLSLPFTFAVLPPTQAAAMVVIVGVCMTLTAHALLSAYASATTTTNDLVGVGVGHLVDLASYRSLATHAVGHHFGTFVSVVLVVGICGGCVGTIRIARGLMPHIASLVYEIIFTDHYATLLSPTQTAIETALLWTIFGVIVFPLCILRSVSGLRIPNVCALVCWILVTVVVVYRASSATSLSLTSTTMHVLAMATINDTDASARMAVSIYSYAFTMHLNLLPLFQQLRGANNGGERMHIANTTRLMTKCIATAMLLCMALYVCFGLFAVQLYSPIQGHFLMSMRGDPSMRLPLVVVFVAVLLSFPPLFHPGRVIVQELLTQKPAAQLRWRSRVLTAAVLLATELLVATWVPGIEMVFALVGATTTVFSCYAVPVVMFTALWPWRESPSGQLWCCVLWGIVAAMATMGMRTVVFLLTDA